MKRWITADPHLGETRIELMQRPFKSPEEQLTVLRDNHNAVVAPEDIVYIVGDVVSKSSVDPTYWLQQLDTFNGKKVLFRGNHDVIFTDKELEPYFTMIVPEGDGCYVEVPPTSDKEKTLRCWVTHYPTQSKVDAFNLVGHIHSSWKMQLNMLNVGVDVHHFCPVNLDRIQFYFSAICNFYDRDVWCAYDPQNSIYYTERGKKDRYYKGPVNV